MMTSEDTELVQAAALLLFIDVSCDACLLKTHEATSQNTEWIVRGPSGPKQRLC